MPGKTNDPAPTGVRWADGDRPRFRLRPRPGDLVSHLDPVWHEITRTAGPAAPPRSPGTRPGQAGTRCRRRPRPARSGRPAQRPPRAGDRLSGQPRRFPRACPPAAVRDSAGSDW